MNDKIGGTVQTSASVERLMETNLYFSLYMNKHELHHGVHNMHKGVKRRHENNEFIDRRFIEVNSDIIGWTKHNQRVSKQTTYTLK